MTNETMMTKCGKEVMEDDEMEIGEDLSTLGPAVLGLQRIGTVPPQKPTPTPTREVLNARGKPARMRKKNKLFFDDDIVNTPLRRVPSVKKQKSIPSRRPAPVKAKLQRNEYKYNLLKTNDHIMNTLDHRVSRAKKQKPTASERPTPVKMKLKRSGYKFSHKKTNDDIVNIVHHMVSSAKKQKSTPSKRPTPVKIVVKGNDFKFGPKRINDDIVNTSHLRVSNAKKQKPTASEVPTSVRRNDYKFSPKKTPKEVKLERDSSPPAVYLPDRKIEQNIGLKLNNLLKLPKAYKWLCYEWFYSDIDRCLFGEDNDFTIWLKESFPFLKAKELTRVEWTKIRSMIGKPRRCSQAFFNEERLELEKKREKIRALQQRKATDMTGFKDLPPEIPMQLSIGTKVTARLRKPQAGLFTGSIDALDTSNNTYRITFERRDLGTHYVPDYEVLSNETPETISIMCFQTTFNPRYNTATSPVSKNPSTNNRRLRKDPMLSSSFRNTPTLDEVKIGGYPEKLLKKMFLVTNILKSLNNSEAEKLHSQNKSRKPSGHKACAVAKKIS